MKLDLTAKLLILLSVSAIIIFSLASLTGFKIGGQLSEVDADIVYTQPDLSKVQNWLDQAGCGVTCGSEKFGINTNVVLFDSAGKRFPFSTFLSIPATTQSLIDEQGNLLDLGSVQVGLSGVTKSEGKITVTGKIKILLDDVIIADRQFAGQGFTINKTLLLKIDGKDAYTFTFADEGSTWVDESVHKFRVFLYDVEATAGEGFETRSFRYSNQDFLAYLLQMRVDQDKVVVKDATGSVISMFKSDIEVYACGVPFSYSTLRYDAGGKPTGFGDVTYINPDTVTVTVYDQDFKQVGLINSGSCTSIKNIARDSNITIKVEDQQFKIHTPKTTYQYKVECTILSHGANPVTIDGTGCSSNFVWMK